MQAINTKNFTQDKAQQRTSALLFLDIQYQQCWVLTHSRRKILQGLHCPSLHSQQLFRQVPDWSSLVTTDRCRLPKTSTGISACLHVRCSRSVGPSTGKRHCCRAMQQVKLKQLVLECDSVLTLVTLSSSVWLQAVMLASCRQAVQHFRFRSTLLVLGIHYDILIMIAESTRLQ